MLLDAGADLQLVRDPLHLATSIESPDLDSRAIEILVRAGVDVNGRNLEGETPLICATVYTEHSKNFEIISKFDGKLDWNARDKWGNTALDYALEYERPKEVIRLLKRHSALDIFEHDGGSVAQVKIWTWTYGEIGYRCPWCQCWPRCGKKAQRDRYHSDKDEENLVMPGAFR
ncbi:hypothetical protein PHLCEN_2v2122 [Hermanssonia centrifuga]|uniref:Uncharacterized protein n=1 Tax=Hermanssonia centrifuga TaxID=98765 RepID=A0A2R6RQ31_9APHY|nr:hypothetical protein PHLCEN_2v2122 [Hermanssonia centrifuga]